MNMKRSLILFWGAVVVSTLLAFGVSRISAEANFLDDFVRGLFGRESAPAGTAAPEADRTAPTAAPYQATVDYEEAVIKAVEEASPAVISIIVTKDLPVIERCPVNPFGDLPPEFRQFFGPFEFEELCEKGIKRQEVGGGSGFIVSSEGLVLTNKHVVADKSASYTVLTNDGKKYSAKVIALDPVQDIAVVKIEGGGLFPTVKLGDSDSIRLAQTAIAIGNALGEFRNTVSVGIISGLARAINASDGASVERLEGLIQTDAAINPGNSGGPLLNLKGEVVGINTAVASGAENIGFAIPINKAKHDLESVKISGKITVPFLGVRYLLITPDVKEREKLFVDYGVIVRGNEEDSSVMPNSPAAKAGIQAEDIILALNGEKVTADQPLASLIQKYSVGDTVRLTILCAGREITVSVTLADREF